MKISTQASERILLIVVYIAGLVFFRYLMLLGTSNEAWVEKLPAPIINLAIAIVGTVVGAGMAFIEFRIFPRMVNLPTVLFIGLRFFIIITVVTVGIALVHQFFFVIYFGQSFGRAYIETLDFLKTGIFWSLFLYLMLFSIVLNVLKVVHHHIGPNTFINYLTGKYRIPKEEDRIFLFIDLKSSTTIAEQLGHVKYSRFLNTCFNDLTEVMKFYQAEIYQFVGDEAVLTWKTSEGRRNLQCIKLFFAFKQRLIQNQQLYMDKFGIVPEFKASIHTGFVSVAETQGQRRELVYHGDVLNTCARILELCSRFKKELLLSSSVAVWIDDTSGYTTHHLDEIKLRGKGEYTSVFEILQAVGVPH